MFAISLAWLQLTREKLRLAVAIAGVAFAVVLIFMQIGFRDALFESAARFHRRLNGDLILVSPQFAYLVHANSFSRRRLQQARAFSGVGSISGVYVGLTLWKNPFTGRTRDIFVAGVDPTDQVLNLRGVRCHLQDIRKPDVVLFDSASRPEYGPIPAAIRAGRAVAAETANRRVRIAGLFTLGTSFGIDGTLITSDLNFLRIFRGREPGLIDIGLVRRRPGFDPAAVRDAMAARFPRDVLVLTKQEFIEREQRYWGTSTPIGYVFTFGAGALRKQILFDITAEIRAGEIVIVTGPSGSGKTTLLTLIGALRSVQEGGLKVLGDELKGASTAVFNRVRRGIGYIFQAHNLLDSLTAAQNVQTSLLLHPEVPRRQARERSVAMLEAVGLGGHADSFPDELSGGQKQRVAVARALVGQPKIILADEPTASLDKHPGRGVVEIIHDLAKRQGVTVLLVTHDNRILDVADRIIHLEDGRLSSFTDAVMVNTQHMMELLAQMNRKGELARHVKGLPVEQFAALLDQTTAECQQFLRVVEMSNNEAFESMLDQVIQAFTFKIGEILGAERATLFLVDAERDELCSKVAQHDGGKPLEIRAPLTAGIAGRVAATGQSLNVPDAYAEPLFNREVDQQTGYRTRNILCVPIADSRGRVFAVAELLNKVGSDAFTGSDEERFRELARAVGVVLESWWHMRRQKQGR